ncbi:MAG: nitronate monooxygenase family protein [Gemmatimonadetes bacterium]|nr:nitronate monooxygenase family protein [Gemmatimonadota bacterium]
METPFTRHAKVQVPLICGPMYPCSNPELVAAVSAAGALGIVQPIALTYVHGHDFREGLRLIRQLTPEPIGFNALIEGNNKLYRKRMELWIDIALEEGVRFFLTSLGNPNWVCAKVHAVGGVVYHDVTERKWAQKGIDGGVDGLIAVNARAGGHAGGKSPEKLFDELAPFGVPIVSAGGVGTPEEFTRHLRMGYAAVQLGTRFIATPECKASDAYKQAIVDADEDDIVLTERLTGVPVAVIRNAYIEKLGTKAGPFAKWMLRGGRTKHWMRTWYALNSVRRLKKSLSSSDVSTDYWQAGKSVAGIHDVRPAGQVVAEFAAALD